MGKVFYNDSFFSCIFFTAFCCCYSFTGVLLQEFFQWLYILSVICCFCGCVFGSGFFSMVVYVYNDLFFDSLTVGLSLVVSLQWFVLWPCLLYDSLLRCILPCWPSG